MHSELKIKGENLTIKKGQLQNVKAEKDVSLANL